MAMETGKKRGDTVHLADPNRVNSIDDRLAKTERRKSDQGYIIFLIFFYYLESLFFRPKLILYLDKAYQGL